MFGGGLLKHGVPFEAARLVFSDPFAIERRDEGSPRGEERYLTIGMVYGRLLYAARGEQIRIISAREAEPLERRQYHEENS